jgi:hypothetical protein
MNGDQIRRPISGDLSFSHINPGVPLCFTPRCIPPRPLGAVAGIAPTCSARLRVNKRRRRDGIEPFIPPYSSGAEERRRRDGLKPGVKRSETPGNSFVNNIEPLTRGDGDGPLEIAFKRQPMLSQEDFEFLEKRDAPVMFFLPLDVLPHLRNLRFAHGEGAISLLPRETRRFPKGSRNPTGRVRLQFTDQFRDRLVLSQFCQDVNVIGGAIYDQRDSAFAANRPTEVLVNSRANRRRHPRLTVLGGKHDVIQKIAMGGTHPGGPFRRPFSGAWSLGITIPAIPLCSIASCSSAALHCRLYSAAPPALRNKSFRKERPSRERIERHMPPPTVAGTANALRHRHRLSVKRGNDSGGLAASVIQLRRRDGIERDIAPRFSDARTANALPHRYRLSATRGHGAGGLAASVIQLRRRDGIERDIAPRFSDAGTANALRHRDRLSATRGHGAGGLAASVIQRRRRDGIERGVARSETPGINPIKNFKSLKGMAENAAGQSRVETTPAH